MSEVSKSVSVFGLYTIVKIIQLDEAGNEKPGCQFAVMAGGAICYGPYDSLSLGAVKKWAEEHKDDSYPVVEEDSLPNEEAAKAGSDDDTSNSMRDD